MAQILVPIADEAAGSWATAPLWSKVDDDSTVNPTGDGAEIRSDAVGNNTATSNADLKLAAGTDPSSSAGHIIRSRWRHNQDGRTMAGHVELWQGVPDVGTQVASLDVSPDVTTTENEATYTLSAGEADSITDYGTLYVRVWGFGSSGGPSRRLSVDLVELEIPDAGGGTTISATASDGLSAGDTPTRTAVLRATASDGVSGGDGPTRSATLRPSATAAATLSDTASGFGSFIASLVDGISLSDTPSISLIVQASALDGIALSDTTSGALLQIIAASVADGLSLSDEPQARADLAAILADGVSLSDSPQSLAQYRVSLADGLSLSDTTTASIASGLIISAAAADGIAVGGSANVTARFALTVQDGVNFGHAVSATALFAASIADGVTFNEQTLATAQFLASVADTIHLGDAPIDASNLPVGIVSVEFAAKRATVTFGSKKATITWEAGAAEITISGKG